MAGEREGVRHDNERPGHGVSVARQPVDERRAARACRPAAAASASNASICRSILVITKPARSNVRCRAAPSYQYNGDARVRRQQARRRAAGEKPEPDSAVHDVGNRRHDAAVGAQVLAERRQHPDRIPHVLEQPHGDDGVKLRAVERRIEIQRIGIADDDAIRERRGSGRCVVPRLDDRHATPALESDRDSGHVSRPMTSTRLCGLTSWNSLVSMASRSASLGRGGTFIGCNTVGSAAGSATGATGAGPGGRRAAGRRCRRIRRRPLSARAGAAAWFRETLSCGP